MSAGGKDCHSHRSIKLIYVPIGRVEIHVRVENTNYLDKIFVRMIYSRRATSQAAMFAWIFDFCNK